MKIFIEKTEKLHHSGGKVTEGGFFFAFCQKS